MHKTPTEYVRAQASLSIIPWPLMPLQDLVPNLPLIPTRRTTANTNPGLERVASIAARMVEGVATEQTPAIEGDTELPPPLNDFDI